MKKGRQEENEENEEKRREKKLLKNECVCVDFDGSIGIDGQPPYQLAERGGLVCVFWHLCMCEHMSVCVSMCVW